MRTILWPFQFSTTTSYVIEVGPYYMRFFANRQQVYSGTDPLQIATPYAEDDLLELQHTQVNDVVRITHPDYSPRKLSRTGPTTWVLEEIDFDVPPMLDENLTTTTIDASVITGSAITLTASESLFESDHIGAYFRIGHRRDADVEELAISSSTNSTGLPVLGSYTFRTLGTWTADVLLQTYDDTSAAWVTLKKWTSNDDLNVEYAGTATENGLYRIKVENYSSNTDARAVIETSDSTVYGVVKIIAVASGGTEATADVISDLYSTDATTLWSEGAWSEKRGYPRACALHESRVIYGGTSHQPSTIWGSVIDDFDNFDRGTANADESWTFQMAGEQLNAIQWIVSHQVLIVGTTGAEYSVRGDGYGAAITPSAVDVKLQSRYGSAYLPAIVCDGNLLFVERKGLIVNELVYSADSEKFEAVPLTLMSEHITSGGIVQLAWQSDKRILWAITAENVLIGLTYNKKQQVVGWHKHETDGEIESVCCIYGDNDAEDEVWTVVARDIYQPIGIWDSTVATRYAEDSTVNVGSVAVPGPQALTLKIKNEGSFPIILDTVELSTNFDSPWTRSGWTITTDPSGEIVMPGATATVVLSFAPAVATTYVMRLDVSQEDETRVTSIYVRGTGTGGGT